MDSVKLSESLSTPLNFRSTASNTTPSLCPCISFNEYAQVNPQAYFCIPPSNSGQSKCKYSQDAEEKFPVQQHLFPPLPFFSPVFYNSPFTNLYCPHNTSPDTPPKEQQKQPATQPANVFGHKEKCFRGNNTAPEEESKSKNNFLGLEQQSMGHPWYYINPQGLYCGPQFQRCGCGDSLPWTCSSFIVPMMSYCVMWNSRKSNMNLIPGSFPVACQQNIEYGNKSDTTNPSTDSCQTNDFNNNSNDVCEDCLRVTEVTNPDWENRKEVEDLDQDSRRSFKSLTLSSEKENDSETTEESDKSEGNVEVASDDTEGEDQEDEDDEAEDTGTCDWVDEGKDECYAAEETVITNLYFPNGSHTYVKGMDSQPPSTSESYTEIKKLEGNGAPAEEFCTSDKEVNLSDNCAEGEKAFRSRTANHSVQETLERQKTQQWKAMNIKKLINNFTMTDQTLHVHEEAQTSVAAAGDLGGVHCVGYKVNISSCFPEQEFEIQDRTQLVENVQAKEFRVKGSSHPEEGSKVSPSIPEKTPKNVRNFKSGIAKLLSSSKPLETTGDTGKSIKNETKETVQPVLGKRRHSCFPAESAVGAVDRDAKTKIQKTRNKLNPGPEKQQQQRTTRSEKVRKVEKVSKVKVLKDGVKK